MLNSTIPISTWCLIGSNWFIEMESCNRILTRVMNKHIKWTSRTVGKPPITMSTPCHKKSPFSVAFSASKPESSISKPSLSIGRTALRLQSPPFWCWSGCPPRARSYIRSIKAWHPETAVLEGILTVWSNTLEHYLAIRKIQCTAWQYTAAHGNLSSIHVVTWHIYRMNNCTLWSSVFTVVLRCNLRVQKMNTYLRCVYGLEDRAGAEWIDGPTVCAQCNPRGCLTGCWMGASRGNSNHHPKSSS